MGAAAGRQVVVVIVFPQRGQEEQVPAQVVPQEEQVEQPQLAPRLFTQPHVAAVVFAVAAVVFAAAALHAQDCGNSGREKNSSHTFSANSSLGGIWQKP